MSGEDSRTKGKLFEEQVARFLEKQGWQPTLGRHFRGKIAVRKHDCDIFARKVDAGWVLAALSGFVLAVAGGAGALDAEYVGLRGRHWLTARALLRDEEHEVRVDRVQEPPAVDQARPDHETQRPVQGLSGAAGWLLGVLARLDVAFRRGRGCACEGAWRAVLPGGWGGRARNGVARSEGDDGRRVMKYFAPRRAPKRADSFPDARNEGVPRAAGQGRDALLRHRAARRAGS